MCYVLNEPLNLIICFLFCKHGWIFCLNCSKIECANIFFKYVGIIFTKTRFHYLVRPSYKQFKHVWSPISEWVMWLFYCFSYICYAVFMTLSTFCCFNRRKHEWSPLAAETEHDVVERSELIQIDRVPIWRRYNTSVAKTSSSLSWEEHNYPSNEYKIIPKLL